MKEKPTQFKKQSPLKMAHHIVIPWVSALILLFFYYYCIEFPMERSFIKALNDLRENKNAQASEEFKKIVRVFPSYEPVYLNIAKVHFQNGRKKTGVIYYKKSKKISIMTGEVFSERGLIYAKYAKDFDKGIEFYNDHVVKNYLSTLLFSHEAK